MPQLTSPAHEPPSSSPLCTRREAAAWLHLSPRQVTDLTHAGKIPAVHLGAALRYRREDLEAFIAVNTTIAVAATTATTGQEGGAH